VTIDVIVLPPHVRSSGGAVPISTIDPNAIVAVPTVTDTEYVLALAASNVGRGIS